MPDQDDDIALALSALRPRPPGPSVERALAERLDAPPAPRSNVILWFSGLTAAACLALAFLVLQQGPVERQALAAPLLSVADEAVPVLRVEARSLRAKEVAASPLAPAAATRSAAATLPEANYRLVSAHASPASLELLEPVRLRDGTYVRPVRLRRDHSMQWEDPRSKARLVRYLPEESTLLLPLETY
ncbi:MAG: hypothetical protein ACO3ND_08085 [Opitutales bacterium]